jgi:hypothetical protein
MDNSGSMNPVLKWYLRVILSRPIVRAVQWTPEERNAFDLFCRSSCGIKLLEFLRQVIATQTFQAVYKSNVSANARACGMQDMLALLHRLRVFPLEESGFEALEDNEQTAARGSPAKRSDEWRWLGGRGAIG